MPEKFPSADNQNKPAEQAGAMTDRWRDDGNGYDIGARPMSIKDGIDPALLPIERRCLALAANGRSIDEIVRETDIPCERIRAAFDAAIRKLQASNLAEAIFRAARMDLI